MTIITGLPQARLKIVTVSAITVLARVQRDHVNQEFLFRSAVPLLFRHQRAAGHERQFMKSLTNEDIVLPAGSATSRQFGNHASGTEPPAPIHACDIGKAAWPEFCHWMTANLAGVVTTVVRDEGPDHRIVECLKCSLEQVDSVLLANGVTAVRVSVRVNGNCHLFEVPAPSWLRLHYNAAGFVTVLEIGYEEGKMGLRFTGSAPLGTAFTANSWGE